MSDPQGVPQLDFAASSHGGQVREVNEDSYLLAQLQPCVSLQAARRALSLPDAGRQGLLIAVADGMGGQGDGQVASRTAIEAMARAMFEFAPGSAKSTVHDAVERAHEQVMQRAAGDDVSSRMGTTLTLGYLQWPSLYVGHAGDSRAYLLREGVLQQITEDHTVARHIEEQGYDELPEDSYLHHVLYNCLGGGSEEAPRAEVHKLQLGVGDKLLFCSDGLSNEVDTSTLTAELSRPESSEDIAAALVERANRRGGRDNITVVVGQVR